jgi:hypothetical protein
VAAHSVPFVSSDRAPCDIEGVVVRIPQLFLHCGRNIGIRRVSCARRRVVGAGKHRGGR